MFHHILGKLIGFYQEEQYTKILQLTHWSWDEIAAISQTTVWNAFLKWKTYKFLNQNFTEVCS